MLCLLVHAVYTRLYQSIMKKIHWMTTTLDYRKLLGRSITPPPLTRWSIVGTDSTSMLMGNPSKENWLHQIQRTRHTQDLIAILKEVANWEPIDGACIESCVGNGMCRRTCNTNLSNVNAAHQWECLQSSVDALWCRTHNSNRNQTIQWIA